MAYTLSSNSPSAGYIAWTNVTIIFNGASYSVANGSSNLKYVWWDATAPTALKASAAYPTMPANSCIVFLNAAGVGTSVLDSPATSADLIVPGSITAEKISAATITGDKIAAGTITATNIAADTITADQIAAGAVTANELAANSVIAGKVAAGAISATEIAANAITASKLFITDLTNLCTNGKGASTEGWTAYSIAVGEMNGAYWGTVGVQSNTGLSFKSRDNYFGNYIDVKPNDEFWCQVDTVTKNATASLYDFWIGLEIYDASKAVVSQVWADTRAVGTANYKQLAGSVKVPATGSFARILVRLNVSSNYAVSGNGEVVYATNIIVKPKSAGNLIVDGAITASKISAATITGDKIAANTISASLIAAGAVTADKIVANAITSDKIAANAITANHIAAGAITASRISVSDFGNLCTNGDGLSADGWSSSVAAQFVGTGLWNAAYTTSQYCLTFSDRDALYGNQFPVTPGDQFFCSFVTQVSGGGASQCPLSLGLQVMNGAGTVVGWYAGVTRGTGTIGLVPVISGTVTIPAGVAYARVLVHQGKTPGTNTSTPGWTHHVTNIIVRRKSGGELIVDGTITAGKIDSRGLSIKDGNGNVILAAGTALSTDYVPGVLKRNLLDTTWWASTQGPFSRGWGGNAPTGTSDYFERQWMPDGSWDTVWVCSKWSGSASEGAGGFNPGGGNYFAIDSSKTYRFVVFFRRFGGSGTAWWGIQGNTVCDLNTQNANGNPYFVGSFDLPDNGEWYMMVGHVYPANTGSWDSGASGVYRCNTGQKVANGGSWSWAAGATGTGVRAYQYYTAAGGLFISKPIVEVCDGSEVSIAALLASGNINGRNPINSGNIGVFMSDAAIGSAQIQNASITTAKIGDLQVNTLKIGNNAVSSNFFDIHNVGNGSVVDIPVYMDFPGVLGVVTTVATNTTWAPGGKWKYHFYIGIDAQWDEAIDVWDLNGYDNPPTGLTLCKSKSVVAGWHHIYIYSWVEGGIGGTLSAGNYVARSVGFRAYK